MTTTSTTLRILKVAFKGNLEFYELPAFRGAIVKKIGMDHPLFHNHAPNNGLYYRYPLIQYKLINKNPAILCMGEGVDEIHQFFAHQDWTLTIGDQEKSMQINRLNMHEFDMRTHEEPLEYALVNWVALNQKNYHEYRKMESLADQIALLERLLRGNILTFAKGIDWHIPEPVRVNIKRIHNTHPVTVKKQKVLAFTLDFTTNVFLPNYIGLGKSVSLGFGSVKEKKKKNDKV